MKQLRFRTRLIVILSLFAIIPAALLTLLWSGTVTSALPLVSGRGAWESVAGSGERAIAAVRRAPLTAAQRRLVDEHERELSTSLEQARRFSFLAGRSVRVVAVVGLLALAVFGVAASRVAHELKNPLTPIRFAVARLRRAATPELQDPIDVLAAESERLERIARSFADFGRLPEGPAAEIDVGDLVRYTAGSSIPPGIAVDVDVEDDLPTIIGHHDALAGALSNVVLNAVDACEGTGRISVGARRVGNGERGVVEISVADDGPGIAPTELDRIWDPYITGKAGGTGLGLAIARQTVLAHNGTVQAQSTLGKGTRISFVLPSGTPPQRSS